MRIAKFILSTLAALLLAAGGVTHFGPWTVPAGASELFIAVGDVFAYAGYTPIALPGPIAKLCSGIGLSLAVFVASHAVAWGDGRKHLALIIVGFSAAVLSSLGRGLPAGPGEPPSTKS